tara:strand:+ start:218 stop:379 length:162 start_codon:yes stop_codon:yes gene_type:complete
MTEYLDQVNDYEEEAHLQALLEEYGIEEMLSRNDTLEDTILPPQDELPEWLKD